MKATNQNNKHMGSILFRGDPLFALLFTVTVSVAPAFAQNFDIKLNLQKGQILSIRKEETTTIDTYVPLWGTERVESTETYVLSMKVVAVKGSNYLIEGRVSKLDVDVNGTKQASEKGLEAALDVLKPDEVINKVMQVEVTPYFEAVSSPQGVGGNTSAHSAQRIFDLLSGMLKPAYAGRGIGLNQVWYCQNKNTGESMALRISDDNTTDLTIRGTITSIEKRGSLNMTSSGSISGKVNLSNGVLKSSYNKSTIKGKVGVIGIKLNFSGTRSAYTTVTVCN